MAKSQTIFHAPKNSHNPFVQVDHRILKDPRLSWRAKGLLVYLLSRPKDWTVRMSDLRRLGTEGRDAVRKALRELKSAGYLVQKRLYVEGKLNRWVYEVYERPHGEDLPGEDGSEDKNLLPENLLPENLPPENLPPENPSLNNNDLTNTESTNTDRSNDGSDGSILSPLNHKKKWSSRVAGAARRPPGTPDSWEFSLFRTVTGRRPRRANREDVTAALARIHERLERRPEPSDLLPFYREWTARGYNPLSIKWLTEWAVQGTPPRSRRRGRKDSPNLAQAIDDILRGKGAQD